VSQNARHSVDVPPSWLDDWVTKWLDEQLVWAIHQQKNKEANTDESISKSESPIECSHAETISNLNSSATTSRCETDDRSSIHSTGSQPEIYDELLMLRQVNNEQKTNIHNLTIQLEKLKESTHTR
jgi:hypothetical protein